MIAIITQEQKDLLVGKKFAEDSFFHPIQDADGDWVISKEEIQFLKKDGFDFLKGLQIKPYKKPPVNPNVINSNNKLKNK